MTLYSESHISVKIDGAPTLCGVHILRMVSSSFVLSQNSTRKDQGLLYKRDVIQHFGHQENVVSLINCLNYLPRTEGVFQGDFIGFGGQDGYKPNTVPMSSKM